MVNLLRDEQRNYQADQTTAIKLQNRAQGWADVAQVAGAAGHLAKSVYNYNIMKAKPEEEEAQDVLSTVSKELEAFNIDSQTQGKILDSPEYQGEFRQKAAELFNKYKPDLKYSSAQDLYGKGSDRITQSMIDQNKVNAAKIRAHQAAEAQRKKAAEAAAAQQAQVSQVAGAANDYIKYATLAGQSGDAMSMGILTQEFSAQYDKATDGIGLPSTRREKKLATLIGGIEGHIVGGMTSGNEDIAMQMDYILNDNAAFTERFPDAVNEYVAMNKDAQIVKYGRKKDKLQADLMTKGGKFAEDIREKIAAIDKSIQKLQDEDIFTDEYGREHNYVDMMTTELREGVRNETDKVANKVLGDQRLATRLEEIRIEREQAALGFSDPYDPLYGAMLHQRALQEQNMTHAKRNEDGTYSAVEQPQMTPIKWTTEGEPLLDPSAGAPDGFWTWADKTYNGYRDAMSRVSPVFVSSYDSLAQAHRGLQELLATRVVSDTGSTWEFQGRALDYLYAVANSDGLSESDRRNLSETVAEVFIKDDERAQDLYKALSEGDIVTYGKGLFATTPRRDMDAIIEREPRYHLRSEQEAPGDLFAGVVLPPHVQWQRMGAYYIKGEDAGLKDTLLKAQMDFQSEAINMWRQNKPREEIMARGREMRKQAIDSWYADRYVIDLRVCDEKLANHEKVYEKINGSMYEYGGRDSRDAPIWIDNNRKYDTGWKKEWIPKKN